MWIDETEKTRIYFYTSKSDIIYDNFLTKSHHRKYAPGLKYFRYSGQYKVILYKYTEGRICAGRLTEIYVLFSTRRRPVTCFQDEHIYYFIIKTDIVNTTRNEK